MANKIAIVTGGNRGLGFLVSQKLAMAGYHVVIGARSEKNGAEAVAKIKAANPSAAVEAAPVDVSSLASVRAFVDVWKKRGQPLHVLVNNAGIMTGPGEPMHKSPEGYEATFATNHLGSALLALSLLDELKKSSSPATPSRLINIGSRSIFGFPGMGGPAQFDFDNVNGEKSFDAMMAYKNSKLAMLWFTQELARRSKGSGVTVNAVCPGFVPETAGEHAKGFQKFLFQHVLTHVPGAHTAAEASDNVVWAVTDAAVGDVTGQFFGERKPVEINGDALDATKAAKLWDLTLQMTGAPPPT